jgi:GDSL-like Lipase/Acylhydrolase family
VYAPAPTGPATHHFTAQQSNYLAAGDHTKDVGAAAFTTVLTSWFFLDGIGVRAAGRTAAVVTLGDSITEGAPGVDVRRQPPLPGFPRPAPARAARHRAVRPQPRDLRQPPAERLALLRCQRPQPAGPRRASAARRPHGDPAGGHQRHRVQHFNAGNLPPGVPLECILPNDVVSAAQIISGYQQIIARVHAAGLRVLGATLTPYQGSAPYADAGEATREAVNDWVRTSGAFDGVVDFDLALREPANPLRLLPAYDSGDHIHPGDAANAAMADTVNLNLR